MNLRYGFIKELMHKYKRFAFEALAVFVRKFDQLDVAVMPGTQEHAAKVVRAFQDIFSWLPLATVVDNKVLVIHGGISDQTDLNYLARIERHKYLSVLRPPIKAPEKQENGGLIIESHMTDNHTDEERVNLREWRQILDSLWSDPQLPAGCCPNVFRGGGCCFGPDVTKQILDRHKLQFIIRSHECKQEGYEFSHDNKVITIFSASNYYELGSNKGAYMKITPDMKTHFVQFMATKSHKQIALSQRLSLVEKSALKDLKEKLYSHQTLITEEFQKYDPANTGFISSEDWCRAVENVLKLDLPWRILRSQLAKSAPRGLVEYATTFQQYTLSQVSPSDGPSIAEALYRNKSSLETIFRIMDKDNSGLISMDEFEESCKVLSLHIHQPISAKYINDLAQSIDMNKDGYIDFNEFLEAFRLVNRDHRNSIREQRTNE